MSRRACFKCGNIGHYAEVCSSSERLCYNCKQPGHESNGCPHPRTTDAKQCYQCQGVGHVQADCPAAQYGGETNLCYSCGIAGHFARNCQASMSMNNPPTAPRADRPGYAGPRGGYTGGTRPSTATCYNCGGPNHFARDCQAQTTKCYACGRLGHISRDCNSPNGGSATDSSTKTCFKCGGDGHISKNCPQSDEINGTATIAPEPSIPTPPHDPVTDGAA